MLHTYFNWLFEKNDKLELMGIDHSGEACEKEAEARKNGTWESTSERLNNPMYDNAYYKKCEERRKNLNNESTDPLNVVIQPITVNTQDIKDAGIIKPPSFEFRPTSFDEFIGQESAKDRAKIIQLQFNRGMRSHVLMSALRGSGKTTFIEILAKLLKVNLIQRIGRQINETNIVELINEINTSTNPKVMLFIDEIDTISPEVLKIFNVIIEQYKIAGRNIRPFIFCGATINLHILIKNNPDFLDRCQHIIQFSKYTDKELGIIILQYKNKLYPEVIIRPDDIITLSLNCRYNPRTAINLLEMLVVTDDIKRVFQACGIIKDGLTTTDIKILNILRNSQKAMGSNVLAIKAGIPEADYLRDIEPFLVEYDYVNRIPSRVLTDKGLKFLKELK